MIKGQILISTRMLFCLLSPSLRGGKKKKKKLIQFSSVQLLSHVRFVAIPWTATRQASLSITNSPSPPKPMAIESVDAIQPSHPLFSSSPPALNLSQHQGLFQ